MKSKLSFTKKVENLAQIQIWFPRRTNYWMGSLTLVMQLCQLRLKITNDNHCVWTKKTKHLYWPQQHSQHDKHKLSLQGGVLSFEESHAYHSDKVRDDILSASTIKRGEKRKIDAQKAIYLLKNLTFMRSMGHNKTISVSLRDLQKAMQWSPCWTISAKRYGTSEIGLEKKNRTLSILKLFHMFCNNICRVYRKLISSCINHIIWYH